MEDSKTKTLDELRVEYRAKKAKSDALWDSYQAANLPLKDEWGKAFDEAEEISREIVRRCMKGESL